MKESSFPNLVNRPLLQSTPVNTTNKTRSRLGRTKAHVRVPNTLAHFQSEAIKAQNVSCGSFICIRIKNHFHINVFLRRGLFHTNHCILPTEPLFTGMRERSVVFQTCWELRLIWKIWQMRTTFLKATNTGEMSSEVRH